MDPLEKFITQNRNLFDDAEPDPGHFKRFEARLRSEERKTYFISSRPVMLRIAASLAVLIAFAFLFAWSARQNYFGFFPSRPSTGQIPEEVRDALSYYDGRVNERLTRIISLEKKCPAGKDISDKARDQIQALDAESNDLKNTLKDNPQNERVIAALIQNQQMKESILDEMIRKGCTNNQ